MIIARSYGNVPMPVPLEVEGDKITGDGPVYYQFVLPLQRERRCSAATQPARKLTQVDSSDHVNYMEESVNVLRRMIQCHDD